MRSEPSHAEPFEVFPEHHSSDRAVEPEELRFKVSWARLDERCDPIGVHIFRQGANVCLCGVAQLNVEVEPC